jgi:hypothetical protein
MHGLAAALAGSIFDKGSIACSSPPMPATGSNSANPTHDPSEYVTRTSSRHRDVFISEIPTT